VHKQASTKTTVVVGMSGGVDSSVSAALVKSQGYHTLGMFMKNWEEDDRLGACPAEQDVSDAQGVADLLGIKLFTRNFATEYWDHVFEHFLDEYCRVRTPNPDILCNREIKFKTFLEHAVDLGGDYIATGHYAQRRFRDDGWQLLRGADSNKDQSYFLYTLGQAQLAKTLFPIGKLHKPRVRELATEYRFAVAKKKDSTGICFIGERNFKPFLQRFLKPQPGDIHHIDGGCVGQHDGLMYYTLGQRKGLGIGGRSGSEEIPWYVVGKDQENNILLVAQGHDHPALFSNRLTFSELSWVAGHPPERRSVTAKIRYRQTDQACTISKIDGAIGEVFFDQPQRAATPGQSIVFYRGEVCLGGGVIDQCLADARR